MATEKKHRLFIGNPGVGKSTLLNCLAQKLLFKSGVSIGGGMTYELQSEMHEGIEYMDTPGLSDVKLRKQAAEAITKALKQDGIYQIFFVVTLEAGRVRSDDLATIKIVLDNATDIVKFNLIVNKLSKNVYKQIEENKTDIAKMQFADLSFGIGERVQPPLVLLLLRNENLEDCNDVIETMKELEDFVQKGEFIRVKAENVSDIPGDNVAFEKVSERLQTELSEIRRDNALMKDHLARSEERFQKLLQQNQELQNALIASSASSVRKSSGKCTVM